MERLKQMEDDSIFNMSQKPEKLFPPPWPKDEEPSELYKIVLRHSHYPPILQRDCRTRASPFKEQRHFRTPSESIANNHRLHAQDLKISKLRNRQRTSHQSLAKAAGHSSTPPGKRHAVTPGERDTSPRASLSPRPEPHATNFDALSSRPVSPTEQLDSMYRQEEKMRAAQAEPTERDLERYTYYCTKGIPTSVLEPLSEQQMINIMRLLPPNAFDGGKDLQILKANLEEEVKEAYYLWLKRSIVDYILMDPAERQRLSISSVPKPFPRRVICAPVPWETSYKEARMWQSQHLFTVNPIMVLLQNVWLSRFSSLRFVRLEDLSSTNLPFLPSEFEDFVQRQCEITRDELVQKKPIQWQRLERLQFPIYALIKATRLH